MYILCTQSKPTAAQRRGCSCSISLCRKTLDPPCCTARRTWGTWDVLCQLCWLLRGPWCPLTSGMPTGDSSALLQNSGHWKSITALPHSWVAPGWASSLAGISSLLELSHLWIQSPIADKETFALHPCQAPCFPSYPIFFLKHPIRQFFRDRKWNFCRWFLTSPL